MALDRRQDRILNKGCQVEMSWLSYNIIIRGGHRQNFPDRLIGWAQAIIAAFHLINGGPPP